MGLWGNFLRGTRLTLGCEALLSIPLSIFEGISKAFCSACTIICECAFLAELGHTCHLSHRLSPYSMFSPVCLATMGKRDRERR